MNTAQIWEVILAEGLRTKNDLSVETNDTKLSYPWKKRGQPKKGLGGKPEMDILLHSQHAPHVYILDAKYKIARSETGHLNPKKSKKSDQYQLFSYSHLVNTKEGSAIHVALIYPWDTKSPPEPQNYERHRSHSSDPLCTLSLVRIPFPTVEDVQTAQTWSTHLRLVGDLLEHQLPELRPAEPKTKVGSEMD